MKDKLLSILLLAAFSLLFSCAKPDTEGNLRIEITSVGDTTFTIRTSAPEKAGEYIVGVVTREDFDRIGNPVETAELLMDNIKDIQTYRGDNEVDAGRIWNIRPKRNYTALAFLIDAGNVIASDPVYVHTTTLEPAQSDNVISLTVVSDEGIISAETTNSDPYFLDCIRYSDIEGYPIGELAEFIIGSYGPAIEYCIESSSVTRDFSDILDSGTEYRAVAFGYLAGFPTGDIVIREFTTPDGPVRSDCTFTSRVNDITATSARVTVTPSDATTSYMTNIHSRSVIDSYLHGPGMEQFVHDQLAIIAEALSEQYGLEISPEDAAGMISIKGEDTYTYTALNTDSEYYVFATGLDNRGNITTDIYLSGIFRTKAPAGGPEAPMECTITVEGMTSDGLSVTVVPEDKEMTYVGMAGEASYYYSFGSDSQYLMDDISLWTEMAAAEQMSLVDLLKAYGLFMKGDSNYIFPESFEPGTLYLAYTYGLNEDGIPTSGMAIQFFMISEDGTAIHEDSHATLPDIREQVRTNDRQWKRLLSGR